MRVMQRGLIVALITTHAWATAAAGQTPAPAPNTHMIDVGGHVMRAQSFGLADRQAPTPVVVFEAGATNALEIWSRVAPLVASFAPVVVYDRAGLGQSEWDGITPTPEHVAQRLGVLLQEIGAGPPYILVGYSWGGVLARYHAGLKPDAVAGIVYVDPGPVVTQTPAEELVPFDEIGVGKAGYDALWGGLGRLMAQAPQPIREEFNVFSGLMRLPLADRRLLDVPPVPSVVIIAGKHQPLPDIFQLPYDQSDHFEADLRHRTKHLAEWVLQSPAGTVVISRAFSHMVPVEDPDIVAWAVRRVLQASQ